MTNKANARAAVEKAGNDYNNWRNPHADSSQREKWDNFFKDLIHVWGPEYTKGQTDRAIEAVEREKQRDLDELYKLEQEGKLND